MRQLLEKEYISELTDAPNLLPAFSVVKLCFVRKLEHEEWSR